MLIPNTISGYGNLAVPGTDYWASTAAHYYINPPGTSADTACVWGTSSNPYGNWSPYVAGANQDASGETYVKLGWNPIYLEQATPFRTQMPNWGVKIDCPNGGCSGLPCEIDPSTNSVNQMIGAPATGAGGGTFCVVTVQKGSTANFVVFGGSGSSSSSGGGFYKGGQFYQSGAASSSSVSSTSSTTTQSSTTSSSTSTSSSDWKSANATESSTYTSSSTNVSQEPTGYPYYSLFNNTVPRTTASPVAATALAGAGPTNVPTGPTEASPSNPVATGGAVMISTSLFAFAPLALWALL